MAHTGRVKGPENLFLIGKWLQPPEKLPVAFIIGKDIIMRICKQEKACCKPRKSLEKTGLASFSEHYRTLPLDDEIKRS